MTPLLFGRGSVEEQVRQVGIDVGLGRLSAQEVFDLCTVLLEATREVERTRNDVRKLEYKIEELRGYEEQCIELQDEVDELKQRVRELEQREAPNDVR